MSLLQADSNHTGPVTGAPLVCSSTIKRPVQLGWIREGVGESRRYETVQDIGRVNELAMPSIIAQQ